LTPFKSPAPVTKSPQVIAPLAGLAPPPAMRSTPPPSPAEGAKAKILVTKTPKSPLNAGPDIQTEGAMDQSMLSNDTAAQPSRSSPPSRPKQKPQADGASLETPFRGERPSFDGNSTYDSIPSASPGAWPNGRDGRDESTAMLLEQERKHVKRLLKIQERLQIDFDEMQKQNKELVLQREHARMVQERETHRQQSHALQPSSAMQSPDQVSMQAVVDEMMLHHSAALDAKNTQIIKATKECQEAHAKIEELEKRLQGAPQGGAPAPASASNEAELQKQVDDLSSDVAAKEKRIASLQASLVSLRKIVQKFEGAKTADEMEKVQKEKAALEQKYSAMAAQLKDADKRYSLAVRAAETAAAMVEKAAANAERASNNSSEDNTMLEKKLRETQRLLLEAYAEADVWRSQQAETAESQSKKEQALEAKLRQVVSFAYAEREELTRRCSDHEQHIDRLTAHLSVLTASKTSPADQTNIQGFAPTMAQSPPPPKMSVGSLPTPPPSGNGKAPWLHSVA
jgi:hypothetical protein